MKTKIFLAFTIVFGLIYSQAVDDLNKTYYNYLNSYEKYTNDKNFNNLKELVKYALKVSEIKMKNVDKKLSQDINEEIESIKEINNIKDLKEEWNLIEFYINKSNKEYLIYLINQEKNKTHYFDILGNLEKQNYETLKVYYFNYLNRKLKSKIPKEQKGNYIYTKLYKLFVESKYNEILKILHNNTINENLKSDIKEFLNKQNNCSDPICDLDLYQKIKSELFILACFEHKGKFKKYLYNKKIYVGCKMDTPPKSWKRVIDHIFRPMDCEILESDYKKLLKELEISP